MRICRCDGLDAETMAEVEGCGMEGESADVNPEIELVARPLTTKALEEISVNMDGEAAILWRPAAV